MREIETLITKKHLSNRNEEHVADVGYTFKSKGRGESVSVKLRYLENITIKHTYFYILRTLIL